MISLISKLFKLFAILVLICLIFTLPPIVNFFAPKFVTPFVIELLPELGVMEPILTTKSYSFAVPFGFKAKGFNLDFDYKYPEFEKASFNLSGDKFSVLLDPIESISRKKLVVSIQFEGLLLKPKTIAQKSGTASSYDYQKYVVSEGTLLREIELTPFYEFHSYRKKLKEAVQSWSNSPIDADVNLEASILNKRHSVPVRDIKEKEIVFDPLLLNDLSLAYRIPLLQSEIDFMQKYPLYALDLLNYRLIAEEHAAKIYPLDLNLLSKVSVIMYHNQISSHFGLNASHAISNSDEKATKTDYELGSSLGRATFKKGFNLENLSNVELINKLIKSE